MKTEFNPVPIDSRTQHRLVMGIPEWMCYYANYDQPCSEPEAIWWADRLSWPNTLSIHGGSNLATPMIFDLGFSVGLMF